MNDDLCSTPAFGTQSRKMFRGDSHVFEVQVLQDDCSPQNITGWTMWFTAKYFVADPDNQAPVRLSNGALGGITFTVPVAGKAEITIPYTATNGFPDTPAQLIYDVQVKDTSNRVFTIESGTLLVNPDATRTVTP